MFRKTIVLILSLLSLAAIAAPLKPLPIDQAFPLSAYVKDPQTLVLEWKIKPTYYLYKERFSYKLVAPDNVQLGNLKMPAGTPKHDALLGDFRVFKGDLAIEVPIKNPKKAKSLDLKVCFQGCSSGGFCYPPETRLVQLDLTDKHQVSVTSTKAPALKRASKVSAQDKVTQLLESHNFWLIITSFLGFGLLLAFTPCVLPMIPILSGLIVGHEKKMTTMHAFMLSLTYVLGMSFTYALIGVAAGLAGQSIQAALQVPWVIAAFSAIFVLLALSLFGFYEIRLPSRFENKISDISNHQKTGSYLGVAFMGVLATLIVSPCITPPLIGALAYIGKTGDSLLGGIALFALGLGMGIPLLIIGTSHGKLLPKAGPWMDAVKASFGVLLLATSIWMIARIIPASLTMFLWAGLLIISAVYMGILSPHNHKGWGNLWRGIGLVLAIYGIMLMIGAAVGNTNPLQPLKSHAAAMAPASVSNFKMAAVKLPPKPLFKTIKNNDEFDETLKVGVEEKKITVLDFYADWCISCKEMEHNVFTDPIVKAKLAKMNVLRSDITANDKFDKALQQRFNVIAPPTILFFDTKGNELKNYRIVGEMNKEDFLNHLSDVSN